MTPFRLPDDITLGSLGVTGLIGLSNGYALILTPARLVVLSRTFEVERVYDLNCVKDAHSITYTGDTFYVASTGSDSVIAFKPGEDERPAWSATTCGVDTVHLNSVLWHAGHLFVGAFGAKAGTLWASADKGFVINTQTGGRLFGPLQHPHSITAASGALWVCESSRGRVHCSDGRIFEFATGYLRGLLLQGDMIYVGSSAGRNYSKSAGYFVGNPADPGAVIGNTGIATYNSTSSLPAPTDFIDLREYGDEIYDIVAFQHES